MKTILSDALNVSLESQAEDHVEMSLEAASLAIETATLDLVTAEHGLTLECYRLAEIESAVSSLESIRLSIESALQEDERGLDSQTAVAYQHAVKAVVGDAVESPILSLESFNSDSQRRHASLESMDRIKDFIKRLIEAMRKTFAKIFEYAKKIIASIARFIRPVKSKADQLRRRLNNKNLTKFTIEPTVTVKNPGFQVPNTTNSVDIVWDTLKSVHRFTDLRDASNVPYLAAVSEVQDLFERTMSLGDAGMILGQFTAFMRFSEIKNADLIIGNHGVDNYFNKLNIGYDFKAVPATSSHKNGGHPYIPATIEIRVSAIPVPDDISVTSIDDLKTSLDLVIKISENFGKRNAVFSKIGDMIEKGHKVKNALSDVIDDIANSIEDHDMLEKAGVKDEEEARSLLHTIINYSSVNDTMVLSRVMSGCMGVVMDSVRYIESCVELYEKKAKDLGLQ